MKKEIIAVIVGLSLLAGIVGGALAERYCYTGDTQKVWGNGDPDPNHIKHFGNDNLSRLCYVQTQAINKQARLIEEFIALNSKQHLKLGNSDIELYNRVRKLEDPNAVTERKTPNKP